MLAFHAAGSQFDGVAVVEPDTVLDRVELPGVAEPTERDAVGLALAVLLGEPLALGLGEMLAVTVVVKFADCVALADGLVVGLVVRVLRARDALPLPLNDAVFDTVVDADAVLLLVTVFELVYDDEDVRDGEPE